MGLKLGGFRAKLFNRNKKKHSSDGVVCLSYQLNPDVFAGPPPVEAQNVGKHEVVKHRRTITKPVVQNIFSDQTSKPDVVPKKSNLKSSKLDAATEAEDNRISTLIHMTSNHDENINKEKDKILSGRHRHETETVSLRSGDNYQSMAESLFFADSSPATNKRPASFHLTDYGDTLSQSSQTSA